MLLKIKIAEPQSIKNFQCTNVMKSCLKVQEVKVVRRVIMMYGGD
jgi:hypothetical protein